MGEVCAGQLHGARTISFGLSLSHKQSVSELIAADVLQWGCLHGGGIQPCLALGCRWQQDHGCMATSSSQARHG